MYFDAVLLLRAVARLGPYLSEYDYCGTNTGTHEDDVETVVEVFGGSSSRPGTARGALELRCRCRDAGIIADALSGAGCQEDADASPGGAVIALAVYGTPSDAVR